MFVLTNIQSLLIQVKLSFVISSYELICIIFKVLYYDFHIVKISNNIAGFVINMIKWIFDGKICVYVYYGVSD